MFHSVPADRPVPDSTVPAPSVPDPRPVRPILRPGTVFTAALLAVLLAGTAAAAPGPQEIKIPMRDGKELAADLYLPAGGGPWPVILIQTPYNKNWYRFIGLPLDTPDYAFVIVDWRGFWGSSGAADPRALLGEDGFDCVEWIAGRTWCDGDVGTWGASALGAAQYATARQHPPHLRACVPLVKEFPYEYEQYYEGGVLRQEKFEWYSLVGFSNAPDIWQHPVRDRYWKFSERVTTDPESFEVPMLIVSGWYDHSTSRTIASYRILRESSDPSVRDRHRLLIGPWTHRGVDEIDQGELGYPEAAGRAEAAALAFLDLWVRGVGSGIPGAPVHWFEMGSNRWRESDDWPPPGVSQVELFLRAGGTLSLSPSGAGSSRSRLDYDPLDPSPTHGGAVILPWLEDGPMDQTDAVESRPDALVFTTQPLQRGVILAGPGKVTLYAASNRLDTDFMVRLTDVYPDGRSMLLADSARRGRFRDGFDKETLMTPGRVYPMEITLPDLGVALPQGHAIRIVVTSSNYPRFQANPNDGGPLNNPAAQPLPAVNEILHDAAHRSRIALTVLR